MPTSSTTWRATGRWLPTACLLLTLAVAGALRTYRLPELPVGLHYDEAANGTLAREIAAGSSRPIFIAAYTGKEVLFFYWTALWMRILDATPAALRLSSALVGIATVAAAVWSTDELLGEPNRPWIGLLTAALLAVSFWHLVLSRYGFRAVTQPLLQALTVGALWHGLGPSRRSTLWLILAGLCCGLTGYTYLAARAFPLPLAAALLTVITADQAHRRQRIGQAAIFVLSALLTLAPLAHYWTAHPDTFLNRASQIAAGSWSEVWQGITACAAMLFIRGDPYIRFNLPLRPLFGPALAICFGIGLIIIVHQLIARLPAARGTTTGGIARESTPKTRAAQVFLLTCLPVMLLPSALATGEITPSNLRTVGLIPFVFVFPAVGLHRLFTHVFNQYVARRIPMKPACALALLVVATLALGTPTTVVAYFRDWAVSPALYDAANGDIVDVARYLNRMDAGTQASTRYVASEHYRHPTLAFLVQDYDAVRSLTGGRTVVLPAGGSGELIYPRSVYDAAGYESLAWVRSALSPIALETTIQGPDGLPAFAAFRVSADTDIVPTHSLQASFAHTVQTLGYDIIGLGENGATVDVAVLWSVLNQPTPGDYGLIARLVDVWGSVWGETVPFHYPAEQWTAGERIYDRLSIPVDAGAPSGEYTVRLGFYTPQGNQMLPVMGAGDRFAGNWVEFPVLLPRADRPPDEASLGMRLRIDASSGDLRLLGANLDTEQARPRERVYLTLFWRAEAAPLPRYEVDILLGDMSLYRDVPVHGSYPTSLWTDDEIVADRYGLRLPPDTPPGTYPLRVIVADTTGNTSQPIEAQIGLLTVAEVERTFDPPDISHPLGVSLDSQVELMGYDLSAARVRRGEAIKLTLYWRALEEMEQDYTVFTHIAAPETMAGQRDSVPLNGVYPTTLWAPGEIVRDTYEIPTRSDAAPGPYRIVVGMYVPDTGLRLLDPTTGSDAIYVATIEITDES